MAPSLLQLPIDIENLLKSYVKQTFFPKTRKADFAERKFTSGDYVFFSKGIAELSRSFTSERGLLNRDYFNKKENRSGYLLYFLPVNALKIKALVNNLPLDTLKKTKRILDLGSGPGTASLGFLLSQPGWAGDITLIDQNKPILKDGLSILRRVAEDRVTLRSHIANITQSKLIKPGSKPFDLIFIANALNEISDLSKRARLINQLIKHHLSPHGRIIIVEPALRRQTRELMELRNLLVEHDINIHAPCLHQAACPMLAANKRDWCHAYWNWEQPRLIKKMDQLVGIKKDYLKASYLVLGHDTPTHDPSHWRIVSGALNSNGKSERLLCGEQALPKLLRIVRLDRNKSKQNEGFSHAMRGDIVATKVLEKLGKTDSFEIITSS